MKLLISGLTFAIIVIQPLVPFALAQPAPPAEMASQAIMDWLDSGDNLKAVVAFGEAAIPTLGAALREGPSPASLESLRLRYKEEYQELKTFKSNPRSRNKLLPTESEFIQSGLDAYVSRYQIRAVAALGAIGGGNAHQILLDAKAMPLSDGVQEAVNLALEQSK